MDLVGEVKFVIAACVYLKYQGIEINVKSCGMVAAPRFFVRLVIVVWRLPTTAEICSGRCRRERRFVYVLLKYKKFSKEMLYIIILWKMW